MMALLLIIFLFNQNQLNVQIHINTNPMHQAQFTSTKKVSKKDTAGLLAHDKTSNKKTFKKDSAYVRYIKRFKKVAISEMEKYKIPASITLAQSLLESNAGRNTLSKKHNNHFGIKCFSKTCRRGHCSNHEDDSHKDFFRIYKSSWESFRDHSLLLQKKHYIQLSKYSTNDYKSWAHGLSKAGYATDKLYAQKLIRLIEQYELHQYDTP